MENLKIYITQDGSLSLYSSTYREKFHDTNGALKESIEKYLIPAQIDNFSQSEQISILDVCTGMGYNSGCILEALLNTDIRIEWHGLEADPKPLKIALKQKIFKKTWSQKVLNFFTSLESSGRWIEGLNYGTIHWGDARQKIYEIDESIRFDVILLDPFSPQKCPELWSEEFLFFLSERLSPEGRLITYSSASSVRATLKRAGLKIYSTIPLKGYTNQWSSGTVAMKKQLSHKSISKNCQFKDLSTKEVEHLITRSSIPYRDPTGKGNSKEILLNREKEQTKSRLIKTSSWRNRWNTAKKQKCN